MVWAFTLFIKSSGNTFSHYEKQENAIVESLFIPIMALKFQYTWERTIN